MLIARRGGRVSTICLSRSLGLLIRRQTSSATSDMHQENKETNSVLMSRLQLEPVVEVKLYDTDRKGHSRPAQSLTHVKPILWNTFASELEKINSSLELGDISTIFEINDSAHLLDIKKVIDIVAESPHHNLLLWLFDIYLLQVVAGNSVEPQIMNYLINKKLSSVEDNEGYTDDNVRLISKAIRIFLQESREHVAYSHMKTLFAKLPVLSGNLENADISLRHSEISKTLDTLISVLLVSPGSEGMEREHGKKIFQIIGEYNKSIAMIRELNISKQNLIPPYIISYPNLVKIIDSASSLGEGIESQRIKCHIASEIGYYLAILNDTLNTASDSPTVNMQRMDYNKLVESYLLFCYSLIEDRLNANDEATAYRLMWELKPFHDKSYSSNTDSPLNNKANGYYYYQLLARVVSAFSMNVRYRKFVEEIISNLSVDACRVSPKLMHALLMHSSRSRNFELTHVLTSQYTDDTLGLDTRFSPAQLGALLSTELAKQNFTKVSEIVKFAKKNMIKFGPSEFSNLIKATLIAQGPSTAWQLIKDAPSHLAVNSYLTYLNFMIDSGKMDYELIGELYAKMVYCDKRTMKVNRIWSRFVSMFFKFTTRNFPLKQSVMIFENASRKNGTVGIKPVSEVPNNIYYGTSNGNFTPNNNPFVMRFDKIRLHLDSADRVMILRTIYYRALSLRDSKKCVLGEDIEDYQAIIKWSTQQLISEGTDKATVLADLKRGSHRKLRGKGLKTTGVVESKVDDERLEESLLKNKARFVKEWFPPRENTKGP